MKACLGQNLKISLPKAYQTKEKSKTLVVKGVPTEFSNDEFKEILDFNKIKYAKAERMKSRRNGRSLQMFKIELKDPAEAEAIISDNLTCPQTGIIFKVAKNSQGKIKCVICGGGHSHKGCPNREKKQPKRATVKDHMLQTIKVL